MIILLYIDLPPRRLPAEGITARCPRRGLAALPFSGLAAREALDLTLNPKP